MTWAVGLLYLTVAILIWLVAVTWLTSSDSSRVPISPVLLLIIGGPIAIQLCLVALIQQGHGWARWVFAVVTVLTIPASVSYLFSPHGQPAPKFYGGDSIWKTTLSCATVLMKTIALGMLFTGSASTWFQGKRMGRDEMYIEERQQSDSSRRVRRAVAMCSGAAFAVSLALPVFTFGAAHEPVRGLSVLVWGWWGFLLGEVAWLANPLFAFALWKFMAGSRLTARIASTATLAVGITSFHAKEWMFNEGGGTAIAAHGLGFYLWLLSLLVLAVGSWMIPDNQRPLSP